MNSPTIIPPAKLSREALEGVIDEFVTREGTHYGHAEQTLEEKREEVRRQVESGDVVILFEPNAETCNLMRRNDLGAAITPRRGRRSNPRAGATESETKLDALILTYVVANDLGALDQLHGAGLSTEDVRVRAAEIGLTSELVKRLKLSGKRPSMRECLKCNASFISSGAQNRLCSRCQ